MAKRYIRMSELSSKPSRPGRLPVSNGTIWRWAAEGKFPAPIRLGPAVTAFDLDAVEAWEASRAQEGSHRD